MALFYVIYGYILHGNLRIDKSEKTNQGYEISFFENAESARRIEPIHLSVLVRPNSSFRFPLPFPFPPPAENQPILKTVSKILVSKESVVLRW